jgi:hypothetical protein
MDKLQEPAFTSDKEFPRLLHGVEELKNSSYVNFQKYFLAISAASIFRYYREVYYYQRNFPKFLAISAAFTFSSYQLAKYLTEDPFVVAADMNNQNEREYITRYGDLYRKARQSNITIPDHLIQ